MLNRALLFCAALAGPCVFGIPFPPAFDQFYTSGTIIVSGDESTGAATLPFQFTFAGKQYTNLYASNNGFLSLGSDNGANCCSGNVSELLSGFPRIAPGWLDLVTDVYQHDLSGYTTFTWSGATFNDEAPVLFQAQLYATGQIIFTYVNFAIPGTEGNDTLIGISQGGGATDPGQTDLLASTPILLGAAPTYYQIFLGVGESGPLVTAGSPGTTNVPFDYSGNTIQFNVEAAGVPEPSTVLLSVAGLAAIGLLRRRVQ